MKKIVITGASGFVGSLLYKSVLKNTEFDPIGLCRNKRSDENLIEIGDIERANFEQVLKDVNVVIHCAARAHVMKDSDTDKLGKFRQTNVNGTLNLAEQAIKAGVKRFIFISSIGVNGSETTTPFTESDAPQPHNDYALSKYEAEIQLKELAKSTNMEVVIIRPPLVYGANAPGNYGKLINLATKKIPLPFGHVNNQRSLVYIENLVDFILTCVEHPNAANETFLVSDDDDTSLANLIKQIRHSNKQKPLLLPVPIFLFKALGKMTGRSVMIESLVGDLQVGVTKAKTVLNWKPPYTFEQGIQRTMEGYKNNNA